MNNLRKNWKDNGTPFYFRLEFDGNVIQFSQDKCTYLDSILFDPSNNITLMDVLVDIQFINRMLQRCTDKMVISSIKYELWQLATIVNQFSVNYVSKSVSNT